MPQVPNSGMGEPPHSIHAVHSRAYVLKTLWHNRAPVTIATGFVQLAKLITEFQLFRLVGFSLLANRPHIITKPGPRRFRYPDALKHLVTTEKNKIGKQSFLVYTGKVLEMSKTEG